MNVTAFCTQSKVMVVAGKGGVGKTTVTAALARLAANAGLSVLIIELEGKEGVTTAFGHSGPLEYVESILGIASGNGPTDARSDHEYHSGDVEPPVERGTVRARRITPDEALHEYMEDRGLRRITRHLVSSGASEMVATAIPGVRDILVLGKVRQLEQQGVADVILVDAPATGHVMTFLTSAQGMLDAARGGPIRVQAAEVVKMLSDPARCQVALVTLPEEMPINEAIEAASELRERAGVRVGPVIVNSCYDDIPDLETSTEKAAGDAEVTLTRQAASAVEAARMFRLGRHALQGEQLARLAEQLPLPQLRTPFVFSAGIGPAELDLLADALARAVTALPDSPPSWS